MNLTRRPIQPKAIIEKSAPVLIRYADQNPLCEFCKAKGLVCQGQEIHHIVPKGRSGPDEVWNIIRLCRRAHSLCTSHEYGHFSEHFNDICMAIKYRKGEIDEKQLHDAGFDYVLITALSQGFKRWGYK